MRSKFIPLAVIAVFALFLLNTPRASSVVDYQSPYDIDATAAGTGDVTTAGTKDVADDEMTVNSGTSYRAFLEFDTSEIPDDATITDVSLYIYDTSGSGTVAFHALSNQPSITAGATLWTDCGDGTTYVSQAIAATTGYNLDLGATADADLEALLPSGWFGVGTSMASGGPITFATDKYATVAYRPILTVTYTVSSGIYYIFDAKYENGTDTTISLTVSSSDGTDIFDVTTDTMRGFTVRPTTFNWEASAGLTRFIYLISDSENITITIPETTPEVYSFTIRDYVGTVGDGDCYLESWRVINGTSTLVERVLIWNSETPTPLILENNKVYDIIIRRNTGDVVKDFGYFVPVGDDPPTLSITTFTFDQYYQPVTNWITVNATRNAPAFTTITVGYHDSLLMTTFAEVTIYNRTSGAIAYTANSTDDDHIFTWGGATNTTTYVAVLNMTHTYYGWVSKTWILDGEFTPGTVPDFSGGGISNDIFSVFLILGSAGIASKLNRSAVLLSAAAVAAMLKVVGFFSAGWEGIVLMGIFALAIGLGGGADK